MRRLVQGSFLVFLVACTVDLEVPPATRVSCSTSAECPTGTVCKQNLGLCVETAGDDGQPPTLSDVRLTPSIATVGGELALTLTTDEPLGVAPDAMVGTFGHFTVTSADSAMQTFELRYQVRGTEAPGQQPINVTLIDVFGNAIQTVAASASLDFIAPRLGLALWTLPGFKRAVKPGDLVALLVNVDADATLVEARLFADTTAIADVTSAFLLSAASDGLQLVGEVTIPADVADGALVSVGFGLSDAAGNVTNPQAALSPPLPVDASPPAGTLTLPAATTEPSAPAMLTTSDAVSVRLEGDIQSPLGAQAPVPSTLTVLFSAGNGDKNVRAIFEDAAGNQFTTPTRVVAVDVPPGAGSPGTLCNVNTECNSLRCACADATCTAPRRCAPDTSCGVCNVNASGVCQGPVTSGSVDPIGCTTPNVCATAASCLVARGQACTLPSDCITGFCECKDAGCTGKVCADADCAFCKAGVTCAINRANDTVCEAGKVCRVGECVVRSPGTCTATCNGNFAVPPDPCPPYSFTADNCNVAQGFAPSFTGSCPSTGGCRPGSPDCSCL